MRQQTLHWIFAWALGAALYGPSHADTTTVPLVQTAQGTVSGQLINNVRVYRGLPYAAPPVGDLRWLAPQAPIPWSGTRDGTSYGDRCAQPLSSLSPESGNEDCLFLNVHVPDDIGRDKLPVMVWIHGGAFLSGSAAEYDLTALARKTHTVVVSINYRVGAFGFFRHPDLVAQGQSSNLGLQDQQAALRWVQAQIDHFGGDRHRVTIFGQSAGAASTCLHLVSPASRGLFDGVISQSGPCNLLTDTPPNDMQAQSVALGVKLSCPEGPGQLACLRQKPALDVVRASVASGNEVRDVDLRWSPVADGVTLPGEPAALVRQGRFAKVPVLIGSNKDEARLFIATEYHLALQRPVMPWDYTPYIQKLAGNDAALAAQLVLTYMPGAYGTLDKGFSAMVTDHYFACGVSNDALAMSKYVPTYNYEFTEPDTPVPADPLMPLGAFHGAELVFLFQSNLLIPGPQQALNTAQQALSEQMIKYWGRFAATGSPTGPWPSYWPRFNALRPTSLALDSSGIKVFDAASFRTAHHCRLHQ